MQIRSSVGITFRNLRVDVLVAARTAREDARKLLANGTDPGEVRKAIEAEHIEATAVAPDTFEAVACEWMAR